MYHILKESDMLSLERITKVYQTGTLTVEALRGIDLKFRKSEFAMILGPSGCGKTTLLNIIGGLDRYTDGEMKIQGRKTKEYTEADWDIYRNHRVGFVFQSYNLIPHQTVLGNVELALTLSGAGKAERRKKAEEALIKVGLGDQLRKKPNELSGGQMQRVAIARALVNEPEILLADEPTGALDSDTSIQVMELLKELAREKLVIMVTHNPELAERYATRVIRLLDGRVTDDTAPYDGEDGEKDTQNRRETTVMHFATALGLSFRNLLTKKGRTLLTAFAGSIGIIGIALILSISTGVKQYIDRVQRDTLSAYPLQIEKNSVDMSGLMLSMRADRQSRGEIRDGIITSGNVMSRMLNAMNMAVKKNNLRDFKLWLDGNREIQTLVTDIRYTYPAPLRIYRKSGGGFIQVHPSQVLEQSDLMGSQSNAMLTAMSASSNAFQNLDVFTELLDNRDLLEEQYELISGRMPSEWNEVVLIVSGRNQISDYTLYALGLRDQSEIRKLTEEVLLGNEISLPEMSFSYEELMAMDFRLLLNTDQYEKTESGVYLDRTEDRTYLNSLLAHAPSLTVTGILRPRDDAVAMQSSGGIGYLPSLTEYVIDRINESGVVLDQLEHPDTDVLTGLPFSGGKGMTEKELAAWMEAHSEILEPYFERYPQIRGLSYTQLAKMASVFGNGMFQSSERTLEDNLLQFGVSDKDSPSSIYIYAVDFASKERINEIIEEYNLQAEEENEIRYTDYVGLIMNSVTTIVDAVSYVLIAFVAISLVVSSIMIGVITYISVLERTKEIGILRAIGASRRDIGRVFNAETLIVGFSAGIIGIGATLLLDIVVNTVIRHLTGIAAIAFLPLTSAAILVVISMLLTLTAGLIPSGIAARKDPVNALRSE